MGTGRPSKYNEAYDNLIIEEMSQGKSIAAFAAEIGVARSTIQEWEKQYPTFSVALKTGKAKCAAWWEDRLRQIAMDPKAGHVTAAIFGLKNMAADDWKDKHEMEHSGNMTVQVVKFSESDL